MVTVHRLRRASEERPGGKMAKQRQIAAKPPYDRPETRPRPSQDPAFWLVGFALPAARKIASGAGNILSTVFGTDVSSSSSSSSSSSEEEDQEFSDSSSDVGVEYGNDVKDVSSQGAVWLDQNYGAPLEIIRYISDKNQAEIGKTETKNVIEQLLMQETFTGEESDRIIEIVKTRVMDSPMTNEDVMEPKWFKENKLGPSPESQNHGNSIFLPHFIEGGDMDSPVDMAKSYMHTRPPWASPALNIGSLIPSQRNMNFFKERSPSVAVCSSVSSSKLKKYSLASGSWNILEEIQRVRSRGTNNLLRSPCSKSDFHTFDLDPKTCQNSLVHKNIEFAMESTQCNFESKAANKTIDASSILVKDFKDFKDFNSVTDLDAAQACVHMESLSSNPAMPNCYWKNQVLEALQIIEGKQWAFGSHQSVIPDSTTKQHNYSIFEDKEQSPSKVMIELEGGTKSGNGFPSPRYRLSKGMNLEQTARPPKVEPSVS